MSKTFRVISSICLAVEPTKNYWLEFESNFSIYWKTQHVCMGFSSSFLVATDRNDVCKKLVELYYQENKYLEIV